MKTQFDLKNRHSKTYFHQIKPPRLYRISQILNFQKYRFFQVRYKHQMAGVRKVTAVLLIIVKRYINTKSADALILQKEKKNRIFTSIGQHQFQNVLRFQAMYALFLDL